MTTATRPRSNLFSSRPLRWALGFYIPMLLLGVGALYSYLANKQALTVRIAEVQRSVALAGRMRAHAESMIGSMLLVERGIKEQQPILAPLYELQVSADRLNQIITVFNEGGELEEAEIGRLSLSAIEDNQAKAVLEQLNVVWFGLKERADLVIRRESQHRLDAAIAREASDFSLAQEPFFKKHASDFSARLQAAQQEAIANDTFSTNIALTTAIITLLLAPAIYLLNRARWARDVATKTASELTAKQAELAHNNEALQVAKQEADRIMDTVQEGLLLIDRQGLIGPQYSRELTSILRQSDLAHVNLLSLLQRLLTEKMFNTVKDYVDLLFDPLRKERHILKVNPLADVEVNFSNPEGGFITRYLGFTFRRIVQGDQIVRIFVSIRDITAQVELEKKLRDAEKHKERQLQILLGIIHVEAEAMSQFSKLVSTELAAMNAALSAEHFASSSTAAGRADLRERLNTVFRSIHNIKGNAVFLRLDHFQRVSEEFEAKLTELQNQPALSGNDFLSIVVLQASLRNDLADLEEMRTKITGLSLVGTAATSPATPAPAATPADTTLHHLRALVSDVATRLGREVELKADPLALHVVATEHQTLVRDVLIQLARNAIAHSIETPDTRVQLGKPRRGVLELRCLPRSVDGLIGFAFRDDGHGLDIEKIKNRAESSGLIAPDTDMPPGEIAALIFSAGFSTTETATADSGRGMGMEIIRHKIVDECGGEISVQSHYGHFCEFACYLPTEAAHALSS